MNPRIPPQAPEVEKHLIGAMLLDPEAVSVAVEKLSASDFYLEKNAALFECIVGLSQSGVRPDALTVLEALKKAGTLNRAGGEVYLLEISAEVVSAASAESHAAIVADKAVLRALAALSAESLDYAYSEGADASKGLETALTAIMRISEKSAPSGLVPWRDGVVEALERWSRIESGVQQGILTGLKDYDAILGGFLPSQLHLLGGRPGMGKSALVLQIAKAAGKVAMFSLESLMHEQVERVMAQDGGIMGQEFRTPEGLRRNRDRIVAAVASIKGYPIWVNDTTTINAQQIHAQCRRLKAREGLDMVIVDYLQLVQAVGKHERREREIGSISESLKRMANDLHVPVLAVASLSRDCERREDKRPMLSDFRESGSLESDAHTVTTIYKESQYRKNTPQDYKDIVELAVLKNKNGPKGRVPHLFEGARFRFATLDMNTIARYRQFIDGNDAESFTQGVSYGTR